LVKINQELLVKAIPELLKAGGNDVPQAVTKIGQIVDGINQMLATYKEIAGKPVIAGYKVEDNKPPDIQGFAEARAIKKAEIAGKPLPETAKSEVLMSNEFKELLEGLIKTTKTLQGMGFGDKSIGQVLTELPFTVDQTAGFLSKLYSTKYQ